MIHTKITIIQNAASTLTALRRRGLLLLALGGLTAVFTGCNSSDESGSYPVPSQEANQQVQSLIAGQNEIERENRMYQDRMDAEIMRVQHENQMRQIELSNGNPYMR